MLKLDLRDEDVAKFQIEAKQLLYSVSEFTVKPGQTVELTFYNPDLMQHNLVLVEPGAADEVAQLAIELGADGPSEDYIPKSDKILHATPLLNTNNRQTLKFTAPSEPGEYQYVCTFPGHAPTMRGIMRVEG